MASEEAASCQRSPHPPLPPTTRAVVTVPALNTYVVYIFLLACLSLTISSSIFDAKRLIGRKFDDAEVQSDIKRQNDRVEIIANNQGNRTTPSYVSFSDNERLIGDAAKNQVAMNPVNTYIVYIFLLASACLSLTISSSVFDAKRLIGRKFDDAEVQSDIKHFPFEVLNWETLRPCKLPG